MITKRMLVLVLVLVVLETNLQMSFTSEWVELLRAEPAALKDKSIQISPHNVSSRKARVRTLQFKDILIQMLIQNVSPRGQSGNPSKNCYRFRFTFGMFLQEKPW